MEIALIVIVAVLAVAAIIGLALAPTLNKRGDAAAARARSLVGGNPTRLDHKVVGLGTTPEEAGGLRGLGALAVSDQALAFVTWAPQKTFQIPRDAITQVSAEAGDVRATDHSAIEVHFTSDEGPAVARFRVKLGLHDWLDALGYDWGPEGRPPDPGEATASDD